jgi:apolipoprotein N-acyltransferase
MVPAPGNLNLVSPRIEAVRAGSSTRLVVDMSLVALSAILYTLAFPPFDWSWLGWFALTPLLLAIRGNQLWRSTLYGLLLGVMICAGVAHWMYSAISTYFVALFPLNLILTVGSFVVFVGIYTAATAGAWSILTRRSVNIARWIAIPALWVVCEFARSTFLSGFSWGLLGYTQYRHLALIQIADIAGIYGISFLLACSSYAAAELIFALTNRPAGKLEATIPWMSISFVGAAILATFAYGAARLHQYDSHPSGELVRVAMVEHDMPAQDRWERIYYVKSLLSYVQLTRAEIPNDSADLIIWPEFAVGLYIDQDPTTRLELSRLTRAIDIPLLLGAPRMTDTNRYYNSAYLIAPGGEVVDTYDKMRLLPFAEYHPLGLPSFIDRGSDVPEEFTAGTRATIFSIPKGRFGVMICYEATYPGYARNLTRRGAQFLVNMSNDVWLSGIGGKAAASQHFAMAILRAVENKRALARATMAGVTGFVDEVGHPFHVSEGGDTVTSAIVPVRSELTVYTRFGDWFVLLCAIYSTLCLIGALREIKPHGNGR